jgi:hypothetical protein
MGQNSAGLVDAAGRAFESAATIEAYGARGDGISDDTNAFHRAMATLAAGAVLKLTPGRSYRLTRSLIFLKPLIVLGGAKEQTRLLFDDGAYATLGGQRAALIFPHSSSIMTDQVGAQRSALSGMSIIWIGKASAPLHGALISAPVYIDQVDANAFSGEGFRIEAETPALKGNANGSSFLNCSAQANGGHGFALYGNNANACLFLGARAFDNKGAGFYDASLLGNTYVAAEVDNNKGGGYTSHPDLPSNSVYLGCYAEPGQKYQLNNRNVVLAPLGHTDGDPTGLLRSLPTGELFTPTGHIFAESPTIATQRTNGRYLGMRAEGLEMMHPDGQKIRLTKLLSADYVDLLNGNAPVMRLPKSAIAGNINSARPCLPAGFTVGASGYSGILGSGSAPPREGDFQPGALWLNEAAKPGGYVGWVCVIGGNPGTWCRFGKIEAGV